MHVQRTFSIESNTSKRIDEMSKQQRRNKSQIVEALLRKSMGKDSDEIEHLKEIERELKSLKDIVKSIYRVDND